MCRTTAMYCSECGAVMKPATDEMYSTADQRGLYTRFVWVCPTCSAAVEGEPHYTHPEPPKGERGAVHSYARA